MFYDGALQDGISSAVSQQKTVLCFVTNEDEESQKWENEYLKDSSVSELIEHQAVALRLQAGSEEAGYLAQIFPLPKTPTVVIMKNGELKEYIIPGVSKDEFMRRMQKAFSAEITQSTQPAPEPESPAQLAAEVSPAQTGTSENVRRVLAERAARMQAQKEAAERRANEERAKEKEKAEAEAEAGIASNAAKKHKQAEIYKKKRQEEAEERRRILKRIEDDRAERRTRAAEREQGRIADQGVGDVAASLVNAPESKVPSTTKLGALASLQVRLFDGSTIRSRFPTDTALKDVRTWIDSNRTDGKEPFTLKQVLTPLPNKAIDATEESKSLGELGLAPSSTLILIPVQNYASAYEGSGSSGFIGMILGFFTWLLGLIGLASARPQEEPAASSADEHQTDDSERPHDRTRIRGFQNPNDRRNDQQLYNGNSLNFEPRPDDDDEK